MATHRRHPAQNSFQFVTFTCFKWLPLIDETNIYDYFLYWFSKLEENGCSLCGYVIMPNHIHMLLYVHPNCKDFNTTIGESKRFLAYEIVKRLNQRNKLSLLRILEKGVQTKERAKGKKHQVFRLSFDAKGVLGNEDINRVLDYMHHNPVVGKWNLVEDFTDFKYSSASYYELGKQSSISIQDYRTITSESLSGDSE